MKHCIFAVLHLFAQVELRRRVKKEKCQFSSEVCTLISTTGDGDEGVKSIATSQNMWNQQGHTHDANFLWLLQMQET